MAKVKKSSRWYSVFRSGRRWVAAVIIGSPDNQPQILGRYASEGSAALAAYRHSKMRMTAQDRKARDAIRRERRKAYLSGKRRVHRAASAAVRRAYAAHEARKRAEAIFGWHDVAETFATAKAAD
jgi:hypothetical protein